MEAEVAEFVGKHSGTTDQEGRRLVVRNGYLPERESVTRIGPLRISQPRLDDSGLAQEQRFSSEIPPRHLRFVASVHNLIPILYLRHQQRGHVGSVGVDPGSRGQRGCRRRTSFG
jgi:putative transposase